MKNKIKITPFDTPWEVACMLINAEYENKNVFGEKILCQYFNNEDLRRIGEHLINYTNVEKAVSNYDK